jgi:hypothetical protein
MAAASAHDFTRVYYQPVTSPLRVDPRAAAWALGLVFAIGLAGSVYRIPIQVTDALETIERSLTVASLPASFASGIGNSASMLRPLREVRTKLLVEIGDALGGRYDVAFRGYHALSGVVLVLLFVGVAGARTWTDVTALAFALAVLTGMRTFSGMFREAYPTNHFLTISTYAVATYALARSRGGRLADVAAVAFLVVSLLTLESGVLVLAVAVAAAAAGARGISRPALGAMALVLAGYACFRVGYLGLHTAGLGEHATGLWASVISPSEQVARFGANPLPLYAYNVVMSGLSVLLSQPSAGRWTVAEAWLRGRLSPVFVVEIGSSVLTTALIAWYAFGREAAGRRRWREPVVVVFAAVLVANAAVSWAYAKNEIIGTAGVFYALAAFAAARAWLVQPTSADATAGKPPRWPAGAVVALLAIVSTAWAVRDAGLHFKLRHTAFVSRSEWSEVLVPNKRDTWPANARRLEVVSRLKAEAVATRVPSPAQMPGWGESWWGEE